MDSAAEERVRSAVLAASARWIACFNAKDAAGCAAAYEPDAVMNAKPFGTFRGREAIQAFWAKLHTDGFADVAYVDPKLEVVDENSAVVSANWRMNKAHGEITKELWVLGADGVALLREDDFEALG